MAKVKRQQQQQQQQQNAQPEDSQKPDAIGQSSPSLSPFGMGSLATALENIIPTSFIKDFVDCPSAFVIPDAKTKDAAMDVVARTYDAGNYMDKFGLFDDWKSIESSGFDTTTQLWELISMRNEPVLKYTTDTMKDLSLLLDAAGGSSDAESSSDGGDVSDGDDLAHSDADMESEVEDDGESSDKLQEPDTVGSESEEEEGDDDDESEEGEGEEDAMPKSIVDDEFFSLAEMEKFADDAEEEDMRDRAILAGDYPKNADAEDESEDESEEDEDEVDLFKNYDDEDNDEDDEDDEDPGELMYTDFFEPPKGSKRAIAKASRVKHSKRVKFDPSAESSTKEADNKSESSSDGDDDDEGAPSRTSNLFGDFSDEDMDEEDSKDANRKSEFEKRQEKLKGLINKLEDEAVDKKHWTMVGEVTSNVRPKDSLLEEDLEFDHIQKPVPTITQESTQTLEDIIKRRIINEEWDDVERKQDIQAKPFKPSEQIELNDSAPKKSLAEEYEDEYMAQKAGSEYVPENDAKLADTHKKIDSMFRNLFSQFDALSHFHFTPKPAVEEVTIRTSAPALEMEEKLPVNISHAEQLAPEEIYEKKQGFDGRTGNVKGDTELTREDRKRKRQRKRQLKKKLNTAKKTQA